MMMRAGDSTAETTTVGLKLLNGARSLNGRHTYHLDGTWELVPGDGAYLAVTDGLWSTEQHPSTFRYVVMEGRTPGSNSFVEGVKTFREVRYLRDATVDDLIPFGDKCPYLAFEVASEHMARVFPASAWERWGNKEPYAALTYGAQYLAQIVPARAWERWGNREPWAALTFGAKHLAELVPVRAWERWGEKEPYAALAFGAKYLAKVVPTSAWERWGNKHPKTALWSKHLARVVPKRTLARWRARTK